MKNTGIVLATEAEVKVDMKMDKVRRLLGNRYGEDARVATTDLLRYIVEQGEQMFDADDSLDKDSVELALKTISDLVTRMEKEPVIRPVKADKE